MTAPRTASDRLEAIERRLAAATEWPWEVSPLDVPGLFDVRSAVNPNAWPAELCNAQDAALIANAPADLAATTAALRAALALDLDGEPDSPFRSGVQKGIRAVQNAITEALQAS